MIAAALVGNEARGLLVGEGARQATLRKICERVEGDPAVEAAGRPLPCISDRIPFCWRSTFVSIAPFSEGDVTNAVYRIERAVRSRFPRIRDIYLQAGAFTSVLRSDTNSSTQAAKVVLASCISEPTIRAWQWDGLTADATRIPGIRASLYGQVVACMIHFATYI